MKKELLPGIMIIGVIFLYNSEYAVSDPSLNTSNITAEAGNVTFIDLDLTGQTSDIWQGYFGTVSGGIALENADGDVFYDWNVVDAVGEVIATRDVITDWTLVNCSNQSHIYEEEDRLDIPDSYSNGINDTYTDTNHPNFDIAGRTMTGCRATLTNNATGDKDIFWNVILNANSTSTLYVAILDNDVVGFNGTTSDFQLLVPVNRTTGQSLYNIYVELS